MRPWLPLALTLACGMAWAQSEGRRVALTGSMGDRALLAIDGGAPRVVAQGATVQGVKLVRLREDEAVVEIDGQRRTLRLGEAAVNLGAAAGAGGPAVVKLSGDGNGHFHTPGQINGRSVSFMVDTGATLVSMSEAEAQRLGLAYRDAPRVGLRTANGETIGYRITLNAVRVGEVEVFNVQAVVQPAPLPFILLGNSFLTRFQMQRENNTLTLERRY